MTDERISPANPTTSRMLKQIDNPEFLPVLLYVLEFILPHPSQRAIYCIEEVRESKQSLMELKKGLVSCHALCQKVLTVDKRTT